MNGDGGGGGGMEVLQKSPSESDRPSRMVTAAEAAARVLPSETSKKRAPVEDEREDRHLKRMRWQARVAALKSIPCMAKVATSATMPVGREAGFTFHVRQSTFHAAPRADAAGSATILMASPSAAGRTGTPCRVPSFLTSSDNRCPAIGEVNCVATPPEHSSLRPVQAGPRCKKRKSPSSNIFMRSPLSRMMLAAVPGTSFSPSPMWVPKSSPFLAHGPSVRRNIDLNANPEEIIKLAELNTEVEEVTEMEKVTSVHMAPVASTTSLTINKSTSVLPTFRAAQGGSSSEKRTKKRKSPCWNMGIVRSPLSKMLLTPRAQFRVRSPSSTRGISPLATCRGGQRMLADLDLNVLPIDIDLTIEPERVEAIALNMEQTEVNAVALNVEQEVVHDIDLNIEPENEVLHDIGLNSEQEEAEMEVVAESEELNEQMEEVTQERSRRKEVPDDIRRSIFDTLLARSKDCILKGHETGEVSREFSVHIRTVQRIWDDGKKCLVRGVPVDVSSKKSKRGRKKKEVDVSKLKGLSILDRTTIEDVSKELGCSKSKVHSLKREGIIERVSNTIKPFLTDKNKKERLGWCISMLEQGSIPHNPMFKDLFDFVFIDEKWFNITKKTQRYYKTPDEEQVIRTCKSTNFIPKIMILAAFARPRFANGICTFDGKIGCFPFVTYQAAKRSSVNRKAGTMEMKPINSIKQGVVRQFLIEKVLPAIRAKWPREDMDKPIYIQQDNAPSHINPNDKLFCEAAKQGGFDIRLICQPPNSPDFNILDLGFFTSIQSIQYKTSAKTTEELVAAVDKAFQEYSPEKANRIFLTLHGCLKEAMKIGGGNGYDVPHIRKEMLEKEGLLPLQLSCEATLVQEAMSKLNE